MNPRHGITVETLENLLIDEGAVFINYGLDSVRLLGATNEGNTFTVEQEVREIPLAGARGPVKGGRRIITVKPKMTVNLQEITKENLLLALPGAEAVDYPEAPETATHDSITRKRNIQLTDYVENVALVGEVSGTGEPCICIIKNALAGGNLELALKDKAEAVLKIEFQGHFDPANLDEEPWEIRYPKRASGSGS